MDPHRRHRQNDEELLLRTHTLFFHSHQWRGFDDQLPIRARICLGVRRDDKNRQRLSAGGKGFWYRQVANDVQNGLPLATAIAAATLLSAPIIQITVPFHPATSIFPQATTGEDYRFAPKANRRPSQSFTTNARECHGVLASPRVNSIPWAAYSA